MNIEKNKFISYKPKIRDRGNVQQTQTYTEISYLKKQNLSNLAYKIDLKDPIIVFKIIESLFKNLPEMKVLVQNGFL